MTKLSKIAPAVLACALAACAGSNGGKADSTPAPPASTAANAADSPAAGADISAQLPRYHWKLQEARSRDGGRIDALFARADKPLTLDFHDGRVSVAEAELLRTICAVLHCPLPPMLERS